MFKRKNQGFTLIELLAVIVILTLIMLIVTPLILKMIQTARKEAFRASAYGIAKSAEFKTERNILKGKQGDFFSKYENNVLSEGEKLDFKGTKPKQGIVVATNGKISLAITNGVWCARKGYNDTKITLTKYPEEDNCELEMDDLKWEIVDVGISTYDDGWIKLQSNKGNIRYLVSEQLGNFEFETMEFIREDDGKPVYLVEEFEQFASSQFDSKMFDNTLKCFNGPLSITDNALYMFNGSGYVKVLDLEKEPFDAIISGYGYMVQYVDNTADYFDYDGTRITSYDDVKRILYNGYIDVNKKLYIEDVNSGKIGVFNKVDDDDWGAFGGSINIIKNLNDGLLYYFDVWDDDIFTSLTNTTEEDEGKAAGNLVLLDGELYYIDMEVDIGEPYLIEKLDCTEEEIVDLYQEYLYIVAETETGELIYFGIDFNDLGIKIISYEETETFMTSDINVCMINDEVLDIYSKDLYLNMNGELIHTNIFDAGYYSYFLKEINNDSQIGRIVKILNVDFYYKKIILLNENDEIWIVEEGKTSFKLGDIEESEGIERVIIWGNIENMTILTKSGKGYHIIYNYNNDIGAYEPILSKIELEDKIMEITTEIILTETNEIYNYDGNNYNFPSEIQISKLLFGNLVVDINNKVWDYEDDGSWIYLNDDDSEDYDFFMEILGHKKVMFSTFRRPWLSFIIALDNDNNAWGYGFVLYPKFLQS